MKYPTYLMIICLLIISGQVFSQNICDSDFLTAAITDTDCLDNNGAIDITLTGGSPPFTFQWTSFFSGNVGFNETTEDVSDLTPGFYTVRITDANGEECVWSYLVADGGPVFCETSVMGSGCGYNVGAIDLTCTGGATPYTYLWSNGMTTEDIDNLDIGIYSVTVTDANGCETQDDVSVSTSSSVYCDTISIEPVQLSVGNQIRIDFVVNDFNDIITLQYTMHYDPTILFLESVGNLNTDMVDLYPVNFNLENPGYITFSWFDNVLSGINLEDGAVLYSLFFNSLTTESGEIYIDGNPTIIEVTNSDFEFVYLETSIGTIETDENILSENNTIGIQNAISVYPNPSTDIVTFELENTNENLELQIYDVTGKLILEKEFANEKIILSKNEMTEGMYFYSILTKGQQLTSGKFMLL